MRKKGPFNEGKDLPSRTNHLYHVLTHEPKKKKKLTTIPFDNDATIGNKKKREENLQNP